MFETNSRLQLKGSDFAGGNGKHKTALYVLRNQNDLEVAVTNFGARIVAILTPDRSGNFADVVLGYDTLSDYKTGEQAYFGAIIGRYANRISGSKFSLNGDKYLLNKNEGENILHGGNFGFHAVVWDVVAYSENMIEMRYLSPDGDAGFPGNLKVNLIYELSNDNTLIVKYEATTDKDTFINMTQHSYFNLRGVDKQVDSVESYNTLFNSDYFLPIDEACIPTGEILSVKNTPFDFTSPHQIGERIKDFSNHQMYIAKGYDHCFVLNKKNTLNEEFAAKVVDTVSGRTLEVFTTQPGMQFYTTNGIKPTKGKYGMVYSDHSAFCLETQHFPDSPNCAYFPSTLLRTGQTYSHSCSYKFGVEG
ncbi:MAG: galactose mutarotase [Culturomica sp.]|jgi:aldose 1-epimerase|nr:galactose mutarotase [Culturomica sp.]